MELNKKLQELRKQKGLTQEELAKSLYVSRTAVSKWESGRGYPNMESLKAIARFFSLTLDELLSTDEVLELAEQKQLQTEKHFYDLIFGLLDVCLSLLLILPLFAQRTGETIQGTSLLALDGMTPPLKIAYLVLVLAIVGTGILTLALQNCRAPLWNNCKAFLSIGLEALLVLLLILGLHPYAAVFTLFLLTVKLLSRIKRQ